MAKAGVRWKEAHATEQVIANDQNSNLSRGSTSGLIYITSLELSRQNFIEFPKLKRALLIPALLNCLDKLIILNCFINEDVPASWLVPIEYRTPEERYSAGSETQQQFRQEIYEGLLINNRQKVKKDIYFIITSLIEGIWEIHKDGNYSKIISILKSVIAENEDDISIEETQRHQKTELRSLKNQLIQEKRELEENLKTTRLKLHILGDICEDTIGYCILEKKYTDRWEKTRQHQNNLTCSKSENVYNDSIRLYTGKIDYENRIHNEIENFIAENTEDLQNSIMFWMQKYDDEIEQRDSEMLQLKIKWEQLTEDHETLKIEYNGRAEEINEYLAHKEIIRLAEELERTRNTAAIRIQAWWRGTMVRKKLGPFRPVKKGKVEKPEKGKKKK